MPKRVALQQITKDDVVRVSNWIADACVSDTWFGRYSYGDPAHLGYNPYKMKNASEEEWDATFNNPNLSLHREIFSVYDTANKNHIGEAQITVDTSIGDGQISVLVGDRNLWHKGYGTASVLALLEHAFLHLKLYRVWVDVPEYNKNAVKMFQKIGFYHEGTLRKNHPQDGKRATSVIMGILLEEFKKQYPQGVQSHVIEWQSP